MVDASVLALVSGRSRKRGNGGAVVEVLMDEAMNDDDDNDNDDESEDTDLVCSLTIARNGSQRGMLHQRDSKARNQR